MPYRDPRQHLADLEPSGLEADDRLGPYGRRKDTHVARAGGFPRPYRHPGGGKRRAVRIPPVLDQHRARCFLARAASLQRQ